MPAVAAKDEAEAYSNVHLILQRLRGWPSGLRVPWSLLGKKPALSEGQARDAWMSEPTAQPGTQQNIRTHKNLPSEGDGGGDGDTHL